MRKKPGPKLIRIDWEQVERLCEIHCTSEEIASVLRVSSDTLSRACKREHKMQFCDYIEQKRGSGKASLRRRQWQAAEAGDKTMLIWLGKNWLGQSDQVSHTHSIPPEAYEMAYRIKFGDDDSE